MTCELCDPESTDPRRLFFSCWCRYMDEQRKIEQSGYDTYVAIMLNINGMPSVKHGVDACPYRLGTDERKTWMEGWLRARGDV